jgi:mRNA interferase YafQ
MLKPKITKQFKKDLKRYQNSRDIMKELDSVLMLLKSSKSLLARNRDHSLSGNWIHHRECHVKNDILLIYKIDRNDLILSRLGSHSELF